MNAVPEFFMLLEQTIFSLLNIVPKLLPKRDLKQVRPDCNYFLGCIVLRTAFLEFYCIVAKKNKDCRKALIQYFCLPYYKYSVLFKCLEEISCSLFFSWTIQEP